MLVCLIGPDSFHIESIALAPLFLRINKWGVIQDLVVLDRFTCEDWISEHKLANEIFSKKWILLDSLKGD